jgi:hypothetical protein
MRRGFVHVLTPSMSRTNADSLPNIPPLPRLQAKDAIGNTVYAKAVGELKDAMDLAYLTVQRPADVLQ